MDYWEGINQGDYYLCDRCNVSKLREDEYEDNVRDIENSIEKIRYCDECSNWINLQTWIDDDGNKHTLRSERLIS